MASKQTKAQMAVEMDTLRHQLTVAKLERSIVEDKLKEARATVAALTATVEEQGARLARLEALVAQQPEQRRTVPAASRANQRRCRVLIINGRERFSSWDFGYLANIARNTKLAHPDFSVEVRAV